MSKRRDCVKVGEIASKIKELGLSYKEGAERFGISVGVLYEYNKRQKKQSIEGVSSGMGETERKASRRSRFLPAELQDMIAEYRRSNPEHGFKRIQDHLKAKHLVVVTRKQIREVLKEHGLLETLDSSFDREPSKGTRRFEAKYPGQLYQMDVTYVYITRIPILYLVVIIDDHSRFCVAAELCSDQRGMTLIEVLHNACVNHGKPEKLLTDQGRGFYTWSMERTAFQKYLDDMKIEHIVSEPHSPQTCGKVERLIQTIKKELLHKVRFGSYEEAKRGITDYIKSYNFDRPHQGIDGARPSDRFYGVIGETSRIEAVLFGRKPDLKKGY
ncbi:MAG: DDE-type integrase/transposase/recombinase [Thermodesulfobacteriota bacterium]|nr:DDE-type integrase/transposase/recombinase [Thermodesulfobacteriota bacterium]